jgi:hypothetical protein
MYKTKWEKEKGKGFSALVDRGGGGIPAQSGAGAHAGARMPAQHDPRARDDVGARGDGVGYGPTCQGEREGRRRQRRMGKG